MGIEIDNRMIEAVWRKLPSEVQESCSMGQVVEWLRPVLEIVERDYVLHSRCGVVGSNGVRHRHAILPGITPCQGGPGE